MQQFFSQVEWPTLGLTAVIYGGWLATTYWHGRLPWPLRIACGGWLIAWHSSFQHEAIHGHPTPWRRLNTVLAVWPLTPWLPYAIYRDTHLAHHAVEALTTPGHDPETHYRAPPRGWLGRLDYAVSVLTSTLLARLVLGPPLLAARFLAGEAVRTVREPRRLSIWGLHAALAAILFVWLSLICHMSLGEYGLAFLYPGASLTLLRSFAEHRADPEKRRRVAVVERAPVFGLLFLNNNLHALHHERPGLAWNRLPRAYREDRTGILRRNEGLVYSGYGEVFARFLLRPQDRIVHPDLVRRGGA